METMHTLKPYRIASSQRLSICAGVASCLSNVWSIVRGKRESLGALRDAKGVNSSLEEFCARTSASFIWIKLLHSSSVRSAMVWIVYSCYGLGNSCRERDKESPIVDRFTIVGGGP